MPQAEMPEAEQQARVMLLAEDDICTGTEWQESLAGMLQAEPLVLPEDIQLVDGVPSELPVCWACDV